MWSKMVFDLPAGFALRCFYAVSTLWVAALVWFAFSGFWVWSWFVGFAASAVIAVWILSSLRIDAKNRAVLITGCDSGFGHRLARHLHQMGFHVFAACLLDGQGSRDLDQIGRQSGRLHVVMLDVRDSESVRNCRLKVQSLLPPGGLWALVNNAGIGAHGYVEWTSMETYQKVANVNLFGTIRVTKTFLPLIRKSQGRIVNVSSTLGRNTGPMMSAYSVTKFAIEAFSDSLRLEMKPFKVKVSVVEPGNHVAGTSIGLLERVQAETLGMWNELDQEVRSDYGQQRLDECLALNEQFVTCGRSDISGVIESMADAVSRFFPQSRYVPAAPLVRILFFVAWHSPDALNDWFQHQFPILKTLT